MEPTPPPPQNTGYYRPPTNNPMDPFRPPGVYFDSISTAFEIIKRDWALWLATTLTYILVSIPLAFVQVFAQNGGDFLSQNPPSMNAIIQGQAIGILNTFLTMTVFAGMVHMGVKAANGETIAYRDLFYAVPRIWTIALLTFLLYLSIGLGFVLLVVPGVFLLGVFALSIPIVVEQKVGAVEGMRRSFEVLMPHVWAMFGLILVAGLATAVGYFACCIGILLTFPILPIVLGMHYNYFFPRAQAAQPTAYQFLEPPR